MESMIKVKCQHCNQKFSRRSTSIKQSISNNHKLYCSSKCASVSRKTKINIECSQCHIQFQKFPSEFIKSQNHFCSQSCCAKYYNNKRKKSKPCAQCYKTMTGQQLKNQCCSNKCSSLYQWNNRIVEIKKSGLIYPIGSYHGSGIAKRYITQTDGPNCSICQQPPSWNGKPLTIILDHINGKPDDWRVTNLRLVCPNCDIQLPTFGSKNIGNGGRPKRYKSQC